jgi:hypothetical protein
VFLVDPPHLSTDVKVYKCYWKLSDYLDVMEVIINASYILFTSEKSSLIELMSWIGNNFHVDNPLHGATRKTTRNRANYVASYEDIMMYKSLLPASGLRPD